MHEIVEKIIEEAKIMVDNMPTVDTPKEIKTQMPIANPPSGIRYSMSIYEPFKIRLNL
jgi:hypothetical protein